MSAPERLTCDRCNADAKHKAVIHTGGTDGDLELLFCGHHYDKHEAKLYELGDKCDITTLATAARV